MESPSIKDLKACNFIKKRLTELFPNNLSFLKCLLYVRKRLHETQSEHKTGLKSQTVLKSAESSSVYMTILLRPTLRSQIAFRKLFRLHGDFTASTFQSKVRF